MYLSNLKCKTAKPRSKNYKLFDGGGLYLEITPTGNRWWRLKYRIYNREKRISLGTFPETSLLEAREKREEAKKLIRNQVDPSLVRQERNRLAKFKSSQTFELVTRTPSALLIPDQDAFNT